MSYPAIERIKILKTNNGKIEGTEDCVAVEEPLEIKLEYSSPTGKIQKNIAITMRTPGHDEELALGFLFTEAVIKSGVDIETVKKSATDKNQILVVLKENIQPDIAKASRNFYSSSSCGICGKASIDAIRTASQFEAATNNNNIKASVFYNLQAELEKQQTVFEATGGIHACAVFDGDGKFILLREDIGRHNALDKLIGSALMNNQLPLNNCILVLSGRASFELIQKAVMAGIKIVAAVGAPSSLAVEMANENNITLIGFLKENRFNIYSGAQRIFV